jgi:putative transcriptional regulator
MEMETMTTAGARLIRAANEALAFANGTANPEEYRIHVPAEIDVKALRHRMRLTQLEFSARYGFNVARLRDWEQNRSSPDSAARAYLKVIEREPEAVERALVTA